MNWPNSARDIVGTIVPVCGCGAALLELKVIGIAAGTLVGWIRCASMRSAIFSETTASSSPWSLPLFRTSRLRCTISSAVRYPLPLLSNKSKISFHADSAVAVWFMVVLYYRDKKNEEIFTRRDSKECNRHQESKHVRQSAAAICYMLFSPASTRQSLEAMSTDPLSYYR
jgi:hypothetical protein